MQCCNLTQTQTQTEMHTHSVNEALDETRVPPLPPMKQGSPTTPPLLGETGVRPTPLSDGTGVPHLHIR